MTVVLLCGALAIGSRGRADMIDMSGVDPWDRCGECHGLDGAGNHIKFPRLGGQKQSYIIKQLYDFRAGRRKNDGGQTRPLIADVAFLGNQQTKPCGYRPELKNDQSPRYQTLSPQE